MAGRTAERREGARAGACRDPRNVRGNRFAARRKHDGAAATPDGPWAEFAKAGFYPDLSVLHFVARAITPPRRPRRFDTRFFSRRCIAIAHRIDDVVHPEAELVELVWLPIAEAQKLDLPTITAVVLQELEARVAAGFGHDLPVPFYRIPTTRFGRELL